MPYGNSPKSSGKASRKRKSRNKPSTASQHGVGSPLGHKGVSGAYGKPMAMKFPGRKVGRGK